jgi:hypothetical protein
MCSHPNLANPIRTAAYMAGMSTMLGDGNIAMLENSLEVFKLHDQQYQKDLQVLSDMLGSFYSI